MESPNGKENLQEQENGEKFKRSVSKQVILGLLTNFSSMAPSMSIGFSAVALPALTNALNPNALTQDQASWFASIASLATPLGGIISGPIADKYGRRKAMYVINLVCFIGWLTVASAYYIPNGGQYPVLLAGRVLTGLSTGLSSMPATIYMAEISSPTLRGVFCTWSSISFALGILVVYTLGYVLTDYWGTIALITAALPCLGICFVSFMVPESPSWLIAKNRLDEAKSAMCQIWGTKDYRVEVQMEIDSLIRSQGRPTTTVTVKKSLKDQTMSKMRFLMKPQCLKPFAIVVTYFFFQQFSGLYVIVFYAIDIVREAGVQLDPYLTIVLIGVVRMLGVVLVSYISKIYGRRPLSMVSGSGMTICMLVLAGYITLQIQGRITRATQDSLLFLPVLLLLVYFFTSSLGFLPMPFALSAEMFPRKIRGTASGLASASGYFFNFITVKSYPSMIGGLGRHGVFFFYGAMSLAGTIFIATLLPETKGKSLDEIEEYFGGRGRKRNSLLKDGSVEV